MVVKRTSRPERAPAVSARARAKSKTTTMAKTRLARKSSVTRSAAKKPSVAKPAKKVVKKAVKKAVKAKPRQSAKTRASVQARKDTMEKTLRRDAVPVRKRTAVDRLTDPPPAAGAALIERVSRAIERELTQIEVIVGGSHVQHKQRTEAERRARTLASLARTLREVMLLRAGEKKEKADDDAVPRDLSELRLALARRLDQLVADAKAAHPESSE